MAHRNGVSPREASRVAPPPPGHRTEEGDSVTAPTAPAPTDTTFKAGQTVCHPVHGPVKIASIITRTIKGNKHEYFELEGVFDPIQISVPVARAAAVGLRPILNEEKIDSGLEILQQPAPPRPAKETWAHRMKELNLQLQSGSMKERVCVIREILRESGEHPSSLAERNLLKQALEPVAAEISIARCVSVDDATDLLITTAKDALDAHAAAAESA